MDDGVVRTNSLLNCRYCGGPAQGYRFTGNAAYICGLRCGIQTPILQWEEAVKRWNREPEK